MVEEDPDVSLSPLQNPRLYLESKVQVFMRKPGMGTPPCTTRPWSTGLIATVTDRKWTRAWTSTTFVRATPSPTLSPYHMRTTNPHRAAAIDRDHILPSAAAGIAPEKASAILSQFSRKRRAAALAVPTDDGRVRAALRARREPITLFGEDASDRRDRLRHLMLAELDEAEGIGEDAEMGGMGPGAPDQQGQQLQQEDEAGQEGEEEFYTDGGPELLAARRDIARWSVPRAKQRLAVQSADAVIPLRVHSKFRKAVKERLQQFELAGSQFAAERPVSIARFAPSGTFLAAGNWGGGIKFLDVPSLDITKTLRGHTSRVGGLSWFPGATLPEAGVSERTVNLASGAEDGTINLWSLAQDTALSSFSGHSGRVCRLEFHPSGKYLATASYDTTWRLWDVATTTQLQLQEGHSREVYTVAFNPDGSLLASGGLDSIGRIWDLRTGRTLMILDGHVRELYALDWGPDGHRVLTGSGDGWIKCWDLRMVRGVGGIGAHRSVVADLRWYKGDGDGLGAAGPVRDEKGEIRPKKSGTFVVSGGFDKNVNVFSADDWSLAKTLTGNAGNVLSVDVSRDSKWIASSGHDRTVKLWGCPDGEGV